MQALLVEFGVDSVGCAVHFSDSRFPKTCLRMASYGSSTTHVGDVADCKAYASAFWWDGEALQVRGFLVVVIIVYLTRLALREHAGTMIVSSPMHSAVHHLCDPLHVRAAMVTVGIADQSTRAECSFDTHRK
jgi:hypothetical protein